MLSFQTRVHRARSGHNCTCLCVLRTSLPPATQEVDIGTATLQDALRCCRSRKIFRVNDTTARFSPFVWESQTARMHGGRACLQSVQQRNKPPKAPEFMSRWLIWFGVQRQKRTTTPASSQRSKLDPPAACTSLPWLNLAYFCAAWHAATPRPFARLQVSIGVVLEQNKAMTFHPVGNHCGHSKASGM